MPLLTTHQLYIVPGDAAGSVERRVRVRVRVGVRVRGRGRVRVRA